MTRSGRSRPIAALTAGALATSAACRSSAASSTEAGQIARRTSWPTWPPAPNTSTFNAAILAGRHFEAAARPEQLVEIINRAGEAILEGGLGLPVQDPLRFGNVGAALHRVVYRQWAADDLRTRTGHRNDHIGKFGHRGLDRVAEVYRAGHVVARCHQSQEALDEIVDVAERAGL